MKGVIVHGALLAVMLVYGYMTWTRDKTVEPSLGTVQVWNRSVNDLQAIVYQTPRKKVRIERRGEGAGAYWWGLETRIDKRQKPLVPNAPTGDGGVAPAATPAPAGDAGVAAAPAPAPAPPPAPAPAGDAGVGSINDPELRALAKATDQEDVFTDTTEFPIGEAGDDLVKGLASLRVLRALTDVKDEALKDYGLVGAESKLQVVFKDGTKTLTLGDRVQGGKEHYVQDAETKKVYVLAGVYVDPLEGGAYQLRPQDAKRFDPADLVSIEIKAGDKARKGTRVTTSNDRGEQTKTWADASNKKPDQTLANFVDNVDRLRPTKYLPDLKIADLKLVVTLTYLAAQDRKLATLGIFKREEHGEMPEEETVDPTKPPPTVTEYYVVSETTRVPAMVPRGSAERIEQDIATLFAK